MKVPKFLFGNHSRVTRASIRVAKAIAERVEDTTVYEPVLDTSASDSRLFLSEVPGANGILFYPLLEAFSSHFPDLIRDDASFCKRLVEQWLENEWSLLCLMTIQPWGVRTLRNSGHMWEFVEALDRAWQTFVELGDRFDDARAPRRLSEVAVMISAVFHGYGLSASDMRYPMSMDEMHRLVRRVLSEGKREWQWVQGPGSMLRGGTPT
jgi:hypothetical protein